MGRFRYCTAHLLIDGSGHEDLARQWMEKFGHTPQKAAEFFESTTVRAKTTQVDDQARLVLTTLFDPFKISGDNMSVCPLYSGWFNMDTASQAAKNTARLDLAAILKKHSPDDMPMLEIRKPGQLDIIESPLIDQLWLNSRMSAVMPAITDVYRAYDVANHKVQAKMNAALDIAVAPNNAYVHLAPNGKAPEHWETIMMWADKETAETLWNGNFCSFGENKKTLATQLARSASLFKTLIEGEPGDRMTIIRGMHLMGQDMDRLSHEETGYTTYSRRFIDMAVTSVDSKAFSWLLAIGCDPDLEGHEAWKPQDSASKRIDMAMSSEGGGQPVNAIVEMAEILRVWRARRAARLALEAIDEPQRRGAIP